MVQNEITKKIFFIFLILIIIIYIFFTISSSSKKIAMPVSKTLRFCYTLKNTSNELIDVADFTAMIPAEIDNSQHIISINATEKYELDNANPLNQSIKFKIHNLPPYASKVLNFTIVLELSSKPKTKIQDISKYLLAEKYIEKDSAEVKDLAGKLDNKVHLLYAKSVYEWLINNIKDAGYVSDNKGAQYAIEKKLGDCTEYMYAFVALMRANTLPARPVAGFFVSQSTSIVSASDYHNWAEFYEKGSWKLSDPQKQIFDQQYDNYIIVRFLNGDMSANRFLITDNRLAVSL